MEIKISVPLYSYWKQLDTWVLQVSVLHFSLGLFGLISSVGAFDIPPGSGGGGIRAILGCAGANLSPCWRAPLGVRGGVRGGDLRHRLGVPAPMEQAEHGRLLCPFSPLPLPSRFSHHSVMISGEGIAFLWGEDLKDALIQYDWKVWGG